MGEGRDGSRRGGRGERSIRPPSSLTTPTPSPVYVCNAFYSWPLLKPLTQILYCHKSFSCHPLRIVTNIGMLYE